MGRHLVRGDGAGADLIGGDGTGADLIGGNGPGGDLIGGDGAGGKLGRRYAACHQGPGGDGAIPDEDAVHAALKLGGVQRASGGKDAARSGLTGGQQAIGLHGKALKKGEGLGGDDGGGIIPLGIGDAHPISQGEGRVSPPGEAGFHGGHAPKGGKQRLRQGLGMGSLVGEQRIFRNRQAVAFCKGSLIGGNGEGLRVLGRPRAGNGKPGQGTEDLIAVFPAQRSLRRQGIHGIALPDRTEAKGPVPPDQSETPGGAGNVGQGLAQGNIPPAGTVGNGEGSVGKIRRQGKARPGGDRLGQGAQGLGVGKIILKGPFKGPAQGIAAGEGQAAVVFLLGRLAHREGGKGHAILPNVEIHPDICAPQGTVMRKGGVVIIQRQGAGSGKGAAQQPPVGGAFAQSKGNGLIAGEG